MASSATRLVYVDCTFKIAQRSVAKLWIGGHIGGHRGIPAEQQRVEMPTPRERNIAVQEINRDATRRRTPLSLIDDQHRAC